MPDNDTLDFTPAPVPSEAQLATFDHRNVPSPVEVVGDVRIAAEPTLSGLPPEMRERVATRMANVKADHASFERQFIREELDANSYRLKVLAGPGKDANEYERECFGIMREVYDLECEAERIEAELAEVVDHRTEYDDDGNATPVPVYRFAPETREGRKSALQDVRYRLAQIEREAPARRTAAAKMMQDRITAENEQLAVHAEAKQQADALLRKERVDRLAIAFANNRRDHLG
jgi:hypothetical protein